MYEDIQEIKTVTSEPTLDDDINELIKEGWIILGVKVGHSGRLTGPEPRTIRQTLIWILGRKPEGEAFHFL